MKDLAAAGCTSIVVLHDRDREDEAELRAVLAAIPVPTSVQSLICIPVEELEAWFWADQRVIERVGRGKGKALAEPHRLADPKGALLRLSRDEGKKPLYSVNDNKDLAEVFDLAACEQRCRAFRDLRQFVLRHARVPSPSTAKRPRRRGKKTKAKAKRGGGKRRG